MRAKRIGGALALALLGLASSGPSPASAQEVQAASVTEVGWWTSVAVTSAPEGGFAVGRNASGDSALAAIRVFVMERPATALLTAAEAGGMNTSAAALQVCTTPNQWVAEDGGGSVDDAPRAECDAGAIDLERDDDGVWSAEVASLLDEGEVSLMVVPADPESPMSLGFEVSFEPPDLDAPAMDRDASAGPTSPDLGAGGSGSSGGGAQPDRAPAPQPAPSAAPFRPPAPPRPEVSAAPAEPDEASADVGPGLGEDETASAPQRPFAGTAVSPIPDSDRPWGQALFFVAISAVAAVGASLGRRQLRGSDHLSTT